MKFSCKPIQCTYLMTNTYILVLVIPYISAYKNKCFHLQRKEHNMNNVLMQYKSYNYNNFINFFNYKVFLSHKLYRYSRFINLISYKY